MIAFQVDPLWKFLAGLEPAVAVFWLGLTIFTIGLVILMYTRWGQSRPLQKCMVLSLLAHVMLVCYVGTIEMGRATPPAHAPESSPFRVSLADEGASEETRPATPAQTTSSHETPWETFSSRPIASPATAPTDLETDPIRVEPQRLVRVAPRPIGDAPALGNVARSQADSLDLETRGAKSGRLTAGAPHPIQAPVAERRDAAQPSLPNRYALPDQPALDSRTRPPRTTSESLSTEWLPRRAPLTGVVANGSLEPEGEASPSFAHQGIRSHIRAFGRNDSDSTDTAYDHSSGNPAASAAKNLTDANAGTAELISSNAAKLPAGPLGTPRSGSAEQKPMPNAYRLRTAPDRAAVIERHGGTPDTETAVKAALKWLADNQAANGQWNPRDHAAGREGSVLGRNRQGAGSKADTGITGLALLAFLASGHTHAEGPYREDVRRGLEYLLRSQARDGNLAGHAATFEFMYCHAMAACAISEAYGMTRDERLREPLRQALNYTLRAQDPIGGGWRYQSGDSGDTSQLGWQLMALKSAELAGIPIPDRARQGMIRYLQSVASGQFGGRASYRPRENVSRPMTAEALVCWQFLGLPRQHPAANEAAEYLLEQTPSEENCNVYYWYYATLGLYQLQGAPWQRWNDALRHALLTRQEKTGPQAGAWEPRGDLWGGCGGRVYTTALATLTLEVYYRFLPLYVDMAPLAQAAQ